MLIGFQDLPLLLTELTCSIAEAARSSSGTSEAEDEAGVEAEAETVVWATEDMVRRLHFSFLLCFLPSFEFILFNSGDIDDKLKPVFHR